MGNIPDQNTRIVRGPVMEAWLLRPDIIIKYGHSMDFSLGSFAEAEAYARNILALPKLLQALRAVHEFNNGERDDFDQVADQVDDVLALIEEEAET